jgi:hypothetical protein
VGLATPVGYSRSPIHAQVDRVASPQTLKKNRKEKRQCIATITDLVPTSDPLQLPHSAVVPSAQVVQYSDVVTGIEQLQRSMRSDVASTTRHQHMYPCMLRCASNPTLPFCRAIAITATRGNAAAVGGSTMATVATVGAAIDAKRCCSTKPSIPRGCPRSNPAGDQPRMCLFVLLCLEPQASPLAT